MAETRGRRIAVAQAHAIVGDIDRNLATIDELVAEAAAQRAEVVVTPELFATGYAPEEAWRHDGAAIRERLAEVAKRHGVALVASSVDAAAALAGGDAVEGEGAQHHIAASFFDAHGSELARIHKRHLFGPVEQQWMRPGADYAAPLEWSGGRWGMGICYDVEFPEFARTLAVAGADILLVPTAVPAVEDGLDGFGAAWRYSSTQTSTLQVPARALENGVVIAYANHCGEGFTGHSCIATPYGHNAVQLANEPGVAVLEVPADAIAHARATNTYLADLPR